MKHPAMLRSSCAAYLLEVGTRLAKLAQRLTLWVRILGTIILSCQVMF